MNKKNVRLSQNNLTLIEKVFDYFTLLPAKLAGLFQQVDQLL